MRRIHFIDLSSQIGKPACAFLLVTIDGGRFIGRFPHGGIFTTLEQIRQWPNSVLANECMDEMPLRFLPEN